MIKDPFVFFVMTDKINFNNLNFWDGNGYIECCIILTEFRDLTKSEGEDERIKNSFQSILTTCHDPVKLMIIMVGTIDIIVKNHLRLAYKIKDFRKFLISMCSKIIDEVEDI